MASFLRSTRTGAAGAPAAALRRSALFSLALSAALIAGGCAGKKQPPATTATDGFLPVITHTAVITTTLGDIEVELYGVDAPMTVANFVGLAETNVYDSVLFHRVVPGFVIQGGDPKSKSLSMKSEWGQGGTSIYGGGDFADELNPEAPSYQRGYVTGTLAMANRGPNTNTSQFFIVLDDGVNDRLGKNYTMFGLVRSGMNVVDAIEKNGSDVNPVRILDVKTTEFIEIEAGTQ